LGDVRVFRASPNFLRDILREVVETFGDFQVFSHKITEAAFSASLKCGAIEKYTHSVQFSFFSFKETFYEYIEQKRNFAFVFNALYWECVYADGVGAIQFVCSADLVSERDNATADVERLERAGASATGARKSGAVVVKSAAVGGKRLGGCRGVNV
jgi:hypothetical protein